MNLNDWFYGGDLFNNPCFKHCKKGCTDCVDDMLSAVVNEKSSELAAQHRVRNEELEMQVAALKEQLVKQENETVMLLGRVVLRSHKAETTIEKIVQGAVCSLPNLQEELSELRSERQREHDLRCCIQGELEAVRAENDRLKKPFDNGCAQTVPEALRFLAKNSPATGGQVKYNAEHLYQLADEAERAFIALRSYQVPQCGDKVIVAEHWSDFGPQGGFEVGTLSLIANDGFYIDGHHWKWKLCRVIVPASELAAMVGEEKD